MATAYYQPTASITLLRSYGAASGNIAHANVPGYGNFDWNPASTATANNFSIIAASGVVTGRWLLNTDFVTPLSTYAALRAAIVSTVILPNSYAVMLEGGVVSGDTGAGLFYYVAADSTSADDGGLIIVDAHNRRWYQRFVGAVQVDWYCNLNLGVVVPQIEVSAPIVNGTGFQTIQIDLGYAAYYVDPANGTLIDGSLSQYSLPVDNGFLRANLTYKVVGGTINYAGQTITTGTIFTGSAYNRGYTVTSGTPTVYLYCYVGLLLNQGSRFGSIVFKGLGRGISEITNNSIGPEGICGVGILAYAPSQGVYTSEFKDFVISGTVGFGQINLLFNNFVFNGQHNFKSLLADVGYWFLNCWNQHCFRADTQNCSVGGMWQNNNQNRIDYIYAGPTNSVGTVANTPSFLYMFMQDNSGGTTDFTALGVVPGDTASFKNADGTAVLKMTLVPSYGGNAVGWYNGTGKTTNALIGRVTSFSTASGDLSAVTNDNGWVFTSGALSGTQYASDFPSTTASNAATQITDIVTQVRDCIGIIMDSAEGFNFGGSQFSNTFGEAGIIAYSTNATQGNTGLGSWKVESESPAFGVKVFPAPFNVINFLTVAPVSIGAKGLEIISNSIVTPYIISGTFYSNFGKGCGVYLEGVSSSKISGTCANSAPNQGLVITNSYNIDHVGFEALPNTTGWGKLDLQFNNFRPMANGRPSVGLQNISPAAFSSFTATTGFQSITASKRLTTNDNNNAIGLAQTYPTKMKVQCLLNWTTFGTGTGARLAIFIQELNDAGSVLWTRAPAIVAAPQIPAITGWEFDFDIMLNHFGNANIQVTLVGTGWVGVSCVVNQFDGDF